MRELVNITVSRILKRKTESKRHLYDALAILEGGGQPRLEHNAHALASGADLLRKGQVQTSDEALWAIEGNLAKYDWPPPRLKLWKKALEAYMECSAASSYRRSLYENRQTRIQDGVRKVLKRGNPMEAINKRVREILIGKVERVRVGQWYGWNPCAWDTIMATTPETKDLPVGTRVKVINLPNAPKANTMGQCYIENEAGEFLGMVSVHSLDKI